VPIPPQRKEEEYFQLRERDLTTTYGAFTLDVKSVLNEKSRWHPRWHPMLNEP
jgi:hypothetical protein